MPSAMAKISAQFRKSAHAAQKRQFADTKRLAKFLAKTGKDVSICVYGSGYIVSAVTPQTQQPVADQFPANPWDEVLL